MKKSSFVQQLQQEKAIMHPLHSFMVYKILPIYLIATAVILIAFGILMEIDESKYLRLGLCLLGAFCLITIVLFSCVPFVTKKVLRDEMNRYNFDTTGLDSFEEYFCNDGYDDDDEEIRFDANGMYINGELHYYNHMCNVVFTSNHCCRITIGIEFIYDGENRVQLLLNAMHIKMITDFEIPLQNQAVLDYIINHKEAAFRQIHTKGQI